MTPWPRYRQIGIGVLGWSPGEFAAATIRDLYDGKAGWDEGHGVKRINPPTRERLDELKAKYG